MNNRTVIIALRDAATTVMATALLAVPLTSALAQTTGGSSSGTESSVISPNGRATSGSAAGDNYGATAVTPNDEASKKFATAAIEGNLAEVKLGRLAKKHGSNEAVRAYGAMLAKDHDAAAIESKQAAQSIGATLPTAPNAKQQALYARLSKLSGNDFNKQFVKAMVDGHKKNIRLYELQSKQNDAMGVYAKQTLPTLRHHLEMAEELATANK